MSSSERRDSGAEALLAEYQDLYRRVLVPVASDLEGLLKDHLSGTLHIDRVTARAKSPDRFVEKATRRDPAGHPRYSDPLGQIQDQVGARVIVFYRLDVEPVSSLLLKYFRHIEARDVVPDSEWAFGYFGRHYIFALPADAIPAGISTGQAPRFFELQIKTLFQHAWSEANHDLGYKPLDELSNDQKRRLAYTAAQAWGADRVFSELYEELTREAT